LLFLLGVPIPKSMDGKVLENIFNESFLQSNSIQYFEDEKIETCEVEAPSGYMEDENQEMIQRLRDLGYID